MSLISVLRDQVVLALRGGGFWDARIARAVGHGGLDGTTKITQLPKKISGLVAGTYDSTAVLLEAGAAIEATARKLPYGMGY